MVYKSSTFLYTLIFLFFFLISITFQEVFAENDNRSIDEIPFIDEMGFSTGFNTISIQKLDNGEFYYPILLMGTISLNLTRKLTADGKQGRLLWYFEPQINPVIYKETLSELEFGTTLIGLKYRHEIVNRFSLYAMVGSGPHFITVVSNRQASGYIFSDNFAAGIYKSTKKGIALNLQFRFRHISNAGITEPNWGIDNIFIIGGISKFF